MARGGKRVAMVVAGVLLGGLWWSIPGAGQIRPLDSELSAARARVTPAPRRTPRTSQALVVGIDDYIGGWPKLDNAVKHGLVVAEELSRHGFEVTVKLNPKSGELRTALRDFFAHKGRDPDARLLLWYAGHGHNVGGEAYLVPADAPTARDPAFAAKAMPLRDLGEYTRMAQSDDVMSIFDSCFAGPALEAPGGDGRPADTAAALRRVKAPHGAAPPSEDGSFRELFVRSPRSGDIVYAGGDATPTGEELSLFLSRRIAALTGSAQSVHRGRLPDVKLDRDNLILVLPGSEHGLQIAPPVGIDALELALWQSVAASGQRTEIEEYLRQFPEGVFAGLARKRLAAQRPRRAPAVAPLPAPLPVALDAAGAGKLDVIDTGEPAGDERLLLPGERVAALIPPPSSKPGVVRPAPRETPTAAGRHRVLPVSGTRFRDCESCPEMVVVPAGVHAAQPAAGERSWALAMGVRAEWFDRDSYRRRVEIAQPFALGRHEVTRGEYAAFVRATNRDAGNGCYVWAGSTWRKDASKNWLDPGFAQTDDHPVACVSWRDATAYASWLSRQTGHDYRLPTEAQWDFAARAGTTTARYWGNDFDNRHGCAYANASDLTRAGAHGLARAKSRVFACRDGYAHTAPVGNFGPNEFGLHDMLGNVWEWSEDCWQPNLAGGGAVGGCGRRVMRGGSWSNSPVHVRTASRSKADDDHRISIAGFRVARPQ